MNARTIMSGRGWVVIPEDVRKGPGFVPGARRDAIGTTGGMAVKSRSARSGRSFGEIETELRSIIHHEGPPAPIDDMNGAIADRAIDAAERGDRAGD